MREEPRYMLQCNWHVEERSSFQWITMNLPNDNELRSMINIQQKMDERNKRRYHLELLPPLRRVKQKMVDIRFWGEQ